MKIPELIKILRDQNKKTLANIIETKGSLTIAEYSQYLWSYKTSIPFEQELIDAFKMEFKRLGIEESKWNPIVESLDKYRTIQTAPHTGLLDATSLPAFTLHTTALASMPEDAYYVVGTFSGIPFGNDSYPGVLSFGKDIDFSSVIEKDSLYYPVYKKRQDDRVRDVPNEMYNRISLYENSMRDELVYRSQIPEIFKNVYPHLNHPIQDYLKYKDGETDFTRVMLNSVCAFGQNLFGNDRIIYVDINEVVSNYLTLVLQNQDHFIHKMFFDADVHNLVMNTWSRDAHFFYDMVDSKNGKKQVHAYIDEFILKNKIKEEEIIPEILINKLKNGRLCPGVFLGFMVLSFLNGFQCFGSFKQVGYLTGYKNTWIESGLLPLDIKDVRTDSLTTGAVSNEEYRYNTAIDIILGAKWHIDTKKELLNGIILPIQDKLIAFKL